MSSGNFSKKTVQKQGIVKKSKFDLSHDFSTSFNWGEVQPLMCRLLPTASSNTINMANVIRLSAMNVPTFGRVAFKQSWHFVPMADIFPNYVNLLSGVPQAQTISSSTVDGVILNTEFPTITPSLLMSVLCTKDRSSYDVYSRDGTNVIENEWHATVEGFTTWAQATSRFPNLPPVSNSQSNYSLSDFTENRRSYLTNTLGYSSLGMDQLIKPAAADFVNFCHYSSADWLTCYRLSTKGRRLYKIFLDLGYVVDFNSTLKMNLLPLIAFYKAYFDAYCLPQYQNWETTNAFKLIKYMYELGTVSIDLATSSTDISLYWNGFIDDLSQCWYSENADYVSAHVPVGSDSGSSYNNLPGATDQLMSQLKYVKNGKQTSASEQFVNPSSIHINGIEFSGQYLDQVSDDVLKKLYLSVNSESAAGFNIKDRLLAKGYKTFVDECKSNFIKSSMTPIQISDVNSTADTMDAAGNGQPLGSYAGKGVQYDETGSFTYENSEIGYLIGIGTIVPIQSGYPFSLDPTLLGINRYTFYNPSFDSLSYEQTPKACVGHNKEYYVASSSLDSNVFGLVPRYSGYKIAQNRLSGCFAFNSERASWMPYTLDRDIVENNDTEFHQNESADTAFVYTARSNGINVIPSAGADWRYPTNNSWKGNYNRIFYNEGMSDDGNPISPFFTRVADESYLPTTDNFLVHSAISYDQWANMLPISESFDTIDEDASKPTMDVKS